MFITLTNVQHGEAFSLLRNIDNPDDGMGVGLGSITYTVGWHNVDKEESFSWRRTVRGWLDSVLQSTESTPVVNNVDPGLLSFYFVKKIVEEKSGATLEVNETNGLIDLTVPDNLNVKFTAGILNLLGLDGDGWLDAGKYVGDRPVNFNPTKRLNVHLEQINTTNNSLDGAPTNLLRSVAVVGDKFGSTSTVNFPHPHMKRLESGTISELKISIRDNIGTRIDNHDQPISVDLEIYPLK
jgi:hypothetical protein